MASHLVRNVSPTMLGVNLAVKDGRGFPTTLRLAPGETSRELSEEEFSSAELQKFLTKRVFVDVTGFAERQRVAKAALGGGA